MTVPVIELADLDLLAAVFPELDFTDLERRAVLLESGTKDIQAAPGSGKTTLLAAKLLLLAQKWPYANRGICVLSHTNVARDEICDRLRVSSLGAKLLGYPHFVGTIHSFVNQFLALPLLRSDGARVDVVDNDVFATRAKSLLQYKPTLRSWVDRNPNRGPDAISTLHYDGPNLNLHWVAGNLPAETTTAYTQARELKDILTSRGVFRHEDMFAYAEKLLQRFPDLTQRLSRRFPLVLIDEMQDTSLEQENLLSRVFNDSVVLQRYGDRNQRILNSSDDVARLSFPAPDHLNVTTTKRFPESIAAAVRAVQEHGEPVTAAPGTGLPPVLLLYETCVVTSVIEEFGKVVLRMLPDVILRSGAVKAVCARKQGASTAEVGRYLTDYWPGYLDGGISIAGKESAFRLLSDHPSMEVSQFELAGRANNVKRAILLVLRKAGSPFIDGIRDATRMLRKLESDGVDCQPLYSLCHELTIGRGHNADTAGWEATVDLMFRQLRSLLPDGMSRDEFANLLETEERGPDEVASTSNKCRVQVGDRSVCVQIGTVASVKGETHVATLVLEAHGGTARCFDIEKAMANICLGVPLESTASATVKGLYRNLYVAMSRPRHLLCLAMNKSRSKAEQIESLIANGWVVIEIPVRTQGQR